MELVNSERENSNLDFTDSITKIIDGAKSLKTSDKNNPEFTVLNISEKEQLVIHIQVVDEKDKSIHKPLRRVNFEPQSIRKIEIWYNPLQLDNGELVSVSFNFTEEKWKDQTATRLIGASIYPSEALSNPLRRSPQEGLYPIYDRDTIDRSKMPQRTPIATEEAAELLEKIRNKVLTKLR